MRIFLSMVFLDFHFKSVQFVQIDFLFQTISSRWMDETNGFLIVD